MVKKLDEINREFRLNCPAGSAAGLATKLTVEDYVGQPEKQTSGLPIGGHWNWPAVPAAPANVEKLLSEVRVLLGEEQREPAARTQDQAQAQVETHVTPRPPIQPQAQEQPRPQEQEQTQEQPQAQEQIQERIQEPAEPKTQGKAHRELEALIASERRGKISFPRELNIGDLLARLGRGQPTTPAPKSRAVAPAPTAPPQSSTVNGQSSIEPTAATSQLSTVNCQSSIESPTRAESGKTTGTRGVFAAFCGLLVIAGLTLVLSLLVFYRGQSGTRQVFGYTYVSVSSLNEPDGRPGGELAFARPIAPADIRPEDEILFRRESGIASAQVIEILKTEGEGYRFVVGDAQTEPIYESELIGLWAGGMPRLGAVVSYVEKHLDVALLVTLFLILTACAVKVCFGEEKRVPLRND
ncbi:MAG: hypothetical protein LBT60_02000 [Oscillospiraceae bacterium]|jgi:hypothetical protein|nr:hypothetical protein [Oscillospiraceae bacterium]